MTTPDDVLGFWFGQPPDPARNPTCARPRALWFQRDAAFDQACQPFLDAHTHAAAGDLRDWADEPRSALALVLLLDQLPRNLFRGSARAFASDARAREVARHALARGLDTALPPVWRWFMYLPFEHSEDAHDQRLSVSLFEQLALSRGADSTSAIESARQHRDIIERFGRFPHRNAALGRESTPDEVAFLQEPGSSF
ncbi:DUF924 domain-containing protein [Corallococcus sp. H22C18031201]|uniref:DUF924 family protein n=1 Tax=Citreicoccus inhibens TaxID=2849499 RepID=UPI000E75BC1D|nr:DUF924 family protein [Citreicoccus inhibens]MBU8899396.1 DUF924 domain-containing protein [Citreicoccus inhibens]RJS23931.1 DUF924 domain-containing protein [Corallococcus sp. H22C18031201]